MEKKTQEILEKAAHVFKASLRERLEGFSVGNMTPEEFLDFEKRLLEVLGDVGTLVEKDVLEASDVEVPHVDREGKRYYHKYRWAETYQTFFGKVNVERSVYQANGESKSICPMEERAGIVHHNSTPFAAEMMAYSSAVMVPERVVEFCNKFHLMRPSSTVVKNVALEVGESFEETWDEIGEGAALVDEEKRDGTEVIAVARDGTMINVRGEGWREAMVGTVRYYGEEGEILDSSYVAQMPEHGRARFEEKFAEEVKQALPSISSGRKVVCLGDGDKANWDYFNSIPELARAPRCLDFWHATDYLDEAAKAIFGQGTKAAKDWYEEYREILKNDPKGVQKTIRGLRYRLSKMPKVQKKRRAKVKKAIRYFSKNRAKMRYRWLQDRGFPIGSGIVEAACKTVVGGRMKQSGMRWGHPGGQAIMNLRASVLSDRWDLAWLHHVLHKMTRAAA